MISCVRNCLLAVLSVALTGTAAQASTIKYTATNLAGPSWRYDYTVVNDTLGAPLDGFTVFFDGSLYSTLSAVGGPAGWDILAIQPDPAIPGGGLYDGMATVGGIAPAGSQGGFSVKFNYLGLGIPGPQPFEIYIPDPFSVVASGSTVIAPIVQPPPVVQPPPIVQPPPPSGEIPSPPAGSLLAAGVLAIFAARRTKRT